MSMFDQIFSEKEIEKLRRSYPEGTRIELVRMGEDISPILGGTRGTVQHVDDIGTVHIQWDNGRVLGVIPDLDEFRKLTKEEILEEQQRALSGPDEESRER